MSEKRYLIKKVEDEQDWTRETGGLITEGELKRRLCAIIALEEPGATLGELVALSIPILLHGERKKMSYPFDAQGNQVLSQTEGYMKAIHEPLPYSTTRKDWEEWAGEMPLEEKNLSHWRDALKAWFLTAPCVPKE